MLICKQCTEKISYYYYNISAYSHCTEIGKYVIKLFILEHESNHNFEILIYIKLT